MQLWEILVPTHFNDGTSVSIEHHQVFDEECKKVSNGMTICGIVHGHWYDDGLSYKEKMIPVRIITYETEVRQLARFALAHYKQEAILAYEISDRLVLVKKA